MNKPPCSKCWRNQDYCHATAQDEDCPPWQSWKTQLLTLLARINKKEVIQHGPA